MPSLGRVPLPGYGVGGRGWASLLGEWKAWFGASGVVWAAAVACGAEVLPTVERIVSAGLRDVRRMLLVKLDGIGNYVLLTPFLRHLRAAAPGAEIDLVVAPRTLPLGGAVPVCGSGGWVADGWGGGWGVAAGDVGE